jgi:hypothetical protein
LNEILLVRGDGQGHGALEVVIDPGNRCIAVVSVQCLEQRCKLHGGRRRAHLVQLRREHVLIAEQQQVPHDLQPPPHLLRVNGRRREAVLTQQGIEAIEILGGEVRRASNDGDVLVVGLRLLGPVVGPEDDRCPVDHAELVVHDRPSAGTGRNPVDLAADVRQPREVELACADVDAVVQHSDADSNPAPSLAAQHVEQFGVGEPRHRNDNLGRCRAEVPADLQRDVLEVREGFHVRPRAGRKRCRLKCRQHLRAHPGERCVH